ncbi:MAG: protein phosphatase CheZ [Zoogloeaceae bacterium]|jgi:chemotaxis protein CheZ|nr:protein phosphatase CheZ [Zoogloeaceae bacterium]
MTAENDSQDLEALFDSITAAKQQPVEPPPPSAPAAAGKVGDSDDLQALFDSISAEQTALPKAASQAEVSGAVEQQADESSSWPAQESVFNKLGQMVRQLHTTLHELGYDKLLEKTVHNTIPDAKDRLAYVATLTEQAASRVLNATDIAKPLVEGLAAEAQGLGARWDQVFANQMTTAAFRGLAEETRRYLKTGVVEKTSAVDAQLLDIMMAQDFQDLTGQVIKKIVSLAQELEEGLVKALIEVVPEEKRSEGVVQASGALLNGPVIDPTGRADVVANQQQVDDLLESLGF